MYLYLLSAVSKTQLSPLSSCISQKALFLSFSFIEVENMKLSFHSGALLCFLFLLISSSKLIARPLNTEQGQNRALDKVLGEDFGLELEGEESLKKLLGMEDCISGDEEECLKRRMTLEAHLDYIYTQHHKP